LTSSFQPYSDTGSSLLLTELNTGIFPWG